MENEIKAEKKKTNKVHVIVSVSVTVACLALGAVGGYFIGQLFFRKNEVIDYSKLNIKDFEDDQELLMKKYNSSKASDYTKEFKPYELANISTNKFADHNFVVSKTYGTVNAMSVEQTVRATSIKHNDEYFVENISASSMLQTGKRFYQKNGVITTYNGENIETNRANWNETPQSELSLEEHEDKWGKQ